MQPRTEILLGVAVLGALVVVAASLGRRRAPGEERDERPSTFLAGPEGARGLAEGLERMGVEVRRWRRRLTALAPGAEPGGGGGREALVLLEPSRALGPTEVRALAEYSGGEPGEGDLVLVGSQAAPAMACFGYSVRSPIREAAEVDAPGMPIGPGSPTVTALLVRSFERTITDSGRVADAEVRICEVPPIRSVDTLLVTADGRVAALRIHRADRERSVTLVADGDLFRNRALRETRAGPLVLGLFVGRYQRVVFEETHHGFGTSGSLVNAVLAWSVRSPWGWAAWQLALVGLLALGFGAIRFGPVVPAIVRRRRSPLEHVRALAQALAAARGHDVAVAALVRGLRRRLAPAGAGRRGARALGGKEVPDPRAWLTHLERQAPTPRARAAADTLLTLSAPGQPADAVLRAAHAVEDLWEELRPPR